MRRSVLTVFAFCALVPAAWPQTLPAGVKKVTAAEGITEYAYPNGLRVLLFPDESQPKVTVNITYLVGSRLEGYGETGMAHLLEHLMFRETNTRPDIKKELTDHGAVMNGTTSWDRTNYFETMAATAENLRWAIGLEADRMVNAHIDKKNLDAEMTVVRNEFEAGENSPERILFQRALEAAYAWHNYGKSPIGNRSDIENVPPERLAAFYKKYYQPDDAVLTIAGKFDETQTLAWIADAFGKIPKPRRTLETTYTREPVQDGERFVALRRVGDTQSVLALYHVPAGADPDMAVLEIIDGLLSEAPSGRLYKALVENKKAVSVDSGAEELHDPGFFIAEARLRKDQSLEEARDILLNTVEKLAQEPPTKEEVERIKTRYLKQMELQMANSQSIALQLSNWESQGDWRLLFLTRDRIKNVTPEDVTRVAKAYFKPSNRTLAEFIPTAAPDRAEIPPPPDVAAMLKNFKGGEAIQAGEAFDPSPKNIEARVTRAALPGGMKLALLPKKTRGGTVTAVITLRFGDEKSVFGKAVVGQMAAALLMRGTKTKSRQQIQDELDRLKARLSVTGGATNATASIETVEANLPAVLRLAAEVLREPAYPERDFDELRQQRLAAVEASRSDPGALANITLQKRLNPFPRGDVRYVADAQEETEDLKKVTLDEVRQFHDRFYGASAGEFVVVGQFDTGEIRKLAGELFGDWKSPSGYERIVTAYQKTEPGSVKIETPDKQNATILAGMQIRISDEDPDYPAMELANYMLGGSFGSRLVHRIRDQEGLSYGVRSGLQAPTKMDSGDFLVSIIAAPQNVPKAEASLKDELARAVQSGFTNEEVAAAKKALLEQEQVGRSQDQNLARLLGARERFGRTMAFDEAFESKIAALTADQVNAALRSHLDPAGLAIVLAGDFQKAGVLQ
ncbi:MAG TPA: pitrilysin family protein [Bryobacteraceae bacterium]|nr:pitrilysin family protein [Bryobacteraceae bacterium]